MSTSGAGSRAPTMQDVARAAGVSKALVSIVFRGVPGASEETRARVFQTAEDLGYRANRTASLLARRRTKHLGVTLNVRNTFHAELVEGIQAAADELGYEIVLSTVTARHDESRAVETLLEFRCESVILLGSNLPNGALETLTRVVPVVLIGRRAALGNIDVVRTDDDHGQGLLVDHLVGLGHAQIAHVDGGPGIISADRRQGYLSAMRRHGLNHHVTVVPGGFGEGDGWRAAGELLAAGHLPSAVTASNDHCALGVIDRFARAGVSVPDAVSVTGYDNAPVAQLASVDLTTVSQEAGVQAEWAVRAAVERLEGLRTEPQESILEPRLVVRRTTVQRPVSPSAGGGR